MSSVYLWGWAAPVADLKLASPIDLHCRAQEFLLSRQLEEAARCVRELACPHFHHEVVKRAVVSALDATTKASQRVCVWVKELTHTHTHTCTHTYAHIG